MSDIQTFKRLEGAKVLITGGAGFIGSHLAEKLIPLAKEIISLDNYLSGSQSNHMNGVTYIEGDVRDIVNIFGSDQFDFVFHFGEYSRVEASLTESCVALDNIYKSFPALLQFWKSSKAKLIYSGSSTKFSDNGKGRHLSPYTSAKAHNSELLVDFADWYSLPYSIVYFYNAYGGREIRNGKYSTVVGKFKNLTYNGARELPVTNPGTQRRNFTHVDDITNGILLAASRGNGDGYGIGADEAYSIVEICRAFGCEPNFTEESRANRMTGYLMTKKIKELGWVQEHNLLLHIKEYLKNIECDKQKCPNSFETDMK